MSISALTGDHVQCIEGFNAAIDLQSLAVRHKSIYFTRLSGTALSAAAAAFKAIRIDKALEWLEQGRSILWNLLNHLRCPFSTLASVDPALAQRIADMALLETGTFREDDLVRFNANSEFHPAFLQAKADVEYDGIEQRRLARAGKQL